MLPAPRLSYEQCKRRKTRCDKGSPCSACKNANFDCHTVQRTRLPRGKSGKTRIQSKKLEKRVARIESLLALHADVTSPTEPASPTISSTGQITASTADAVPASSTESIPAKRATSFVAPEFWKALSEEVYGLRETLEDSADEEEVNDRPLDDVTKPISTSVRMGAILFQHISLNEKASVPTLSLDVRTTLLHIYQSRVDTVYKILHWPTTLVTIKQRHCSSEVAPSSLSSHVLEMAIYFLAACTITNPEAETMGLGDRFSLLQGFRSAVEGLFVRSNLLQSPDLVLLQAFVIYLVCTQNNYFRTTRGAF
jgi:hypothetical protein